MNPELVKEKLYNLNSDYSHPSYFLEQRILSEIREGLLDEAIATLEALNSAERAHLASYSVRSLKNSLIASCTLFSRATIKSSVDPEDAFSLSDSFIKRIEKQTNETDLKKLERDMAVSFIELIKTSRLAQYSRPISRVIHHIHEHTTSKLSVAVLAEVAHLSPDYLSKVFHREVGVHLITYIQQRKVAVAKIVLAYSNMRIADIAAMLEFCNAAYFSSVFKKHTGISAAGYRRNA